MYKAACTSALDTRCIPSSRGTKPPYTEIYTTYIYMPNFTSSLALPATSSLPRDSVVGLSNSITVYAQFCSSFTSSLALNCGFQYCIFTFWAVRSLSCTLSLSLTSNLARLPGDGQEGGKRQSHAELVGSWHTNIPHNMKSFVCVGVVGSEVVYMYILVYKVVQSSK